MKLQHLLLAAPLALSLSLSSTMSDTVAHAARHKYAPGITGGLACPSLATQKHPRKVE
jgi:hypothetical protein